MGKNFIDNFSLLHFAVGIIAYFWGIDFWVFNILHILFEIVENTDCGMEVINKGFLKDIWPGGKEYTDSFSNSLADVGFGALGWLLAYLVSNC